MKSKIKILEDIARNNDGVLKTKNIEEAGLSRIYIKDFVDQEILVKESQGVYSLKSDLVDEYKVLQIRSEKLIYSFGTALYLLGLSDRIPMILDLSFPQGYNVSRIKKDKSNLHFHFVPKHLWELGRMDVVTPFGATVQVYDKERSICDLISQKKHVDIQLYTHAIKEYFSNEPNISKIIHYSKLLGVEKQVRNYIEVLL